MSGTFIFKPSIITAQTVNHATWNLLGAADAIAAALVNNDFEWAFTSSETGLSPVTALLRFGLFGNCISLDGGPLISFATLPAGFTPTTAQVDFGGQVNTLAGANYFLQFDLFTESSALPQALLGSIVSFIHPNPVPAVLDLFNNGFGVRYSAPFGSGGIIVDLLQLSGTYDIQAFQFPFSIENPTVPVRTGDKLKINSTGTPPLTDFTTINFINPVTNKILVTLNLDESYYVIALEALILWLYIPLDLISYNGAVEIQLVGPGTQFSGSVSLGTIQILSEDASGIYSLVDGQTSDILYFRGAITTIPVLLFLQINIEEDDRYAEEDFFNLLKYPTRVLSTAEYDDDYEDSDFSFVGSPVAVIFPISVEIPSPFIKTAFLP